MLSAKTVASDNQTVMVIVLPENRVAAVEWLLDKFATSDWRLGGTIFLIRIDNQYVNSKGHIVANLRRQCKSYGLDDKKKSVRYLVLEELKFNPKNTITWVKSAEDISIVSYKLLADYLLEARLNDWGMHWRKVAISEVKKWQYDDLSELDIENWLKQFDEVSGGNKRWVGELLLRNFRVWSPEKVACALQEGEFFKDLSGQPCIIRYENGKSADSIATIIRKRLLPIIGDGGIKEYLSFMEENDTSDCYVFEDGVFTGIEISDLFFSLMGIEGFTKCAPLTNSSRLKSRKTVIRFAIGTDIGLHRVRDTVKKLGIAVEISAGSRIEVLTASGKTNLENNHLYEQDTHGKDVLRSAESDLVLQAFTDPRWGVRRASAIEFCKKIGADLFGSYQKSKGKVWTEARINDCALGTGNMAFLLSFAHSLPKSTLPVFWCHGTAIDQKGREFNWRPLFPSAHKI